MSAAKKNIILLNDGRAGNFNQLKALTNQLNGNFNIIEKKITFSPAIILPNFINLLFRTGLNYRNLIAKLDNIDFIFSAGRRSALAAILLQKKFPKSKIIQLMKPQLKHQYFAFIATPKHDKYKFADYEMLLAPNSINKKNLSNAQAKWPQLTSKTKILAVIIGGDTKNNKITEHTALKLCTEIIALQKKFKLKLLLVTSRRTNDQLTQIIKNKLTKQVKFFFWHELKQENNPYLAILAAADNFLVTADSVSMISDCLATGKPTIIFNSGFGETKHHKLVKLLAQKKYIITSNNALKNHKLDYVYQPLLEAEELKKAIAKKLNF